MQGPLWTRGEPSPGDYFPYTNLHFQPTGTMFLQLSGYDDGVGEVADFVTLNSMSSLITYHKFLGHSAARTCSSLFPPHHCPILVTSGINVQDCGGIWMVMNSAVPYSGQGIRVTWIGRWIRQGYERRRWPGALRSLSMSCGADHIILGLMVWTELESIMHISKPQEI